MTALVKQTALLDLSDIIENHIPHFLYTQVIETRIGKHLRTYATCRHRKQMKRIAQMHRRTSCLIHIVSVGLVYYHTVGHLHYSALDTLQFIARACYLYKQKEIDH